MSNWTEGIVSIYNNQLEYDKRIYLTLDNKLQFDDYNFVNEKYKFV